ncbi:MAG: glycosyltransferase [Anaerolineae bacterium]|nr:glycosyltransferase [Anaerolineae bacterium]
MNGSKQIRMFVVLIIAAVAATLLPSNMLAPITLTPSTVSAAIPGSQAPLSTVESGNCNDVSNNNVLVAVNHVPNEDCLDEISAAYAAGITALPPIPEELTKAANVLFVRPRVAEVNVRTQPNTGAAIVGLLQNGDVVAVIEPLDGAVDKLGVEGQWLLIRTPDGAEGYTAAWLYNVSEGAPPDDGPGDTPDPPPGDDPTAAAPVDEQPGLLLTPKGDGVRIRAQPVSGDVIAVAALGDQIEVTEQADLALAKIGVNGEWLRVRTVNGVEGYTAAWLYTVAENNTPTGATPPPAVVPASEPLILAENTILILTPRVDSVRIRAQPVTGTVVALAWRGDRLQVMEEASLAANKIGVDGEWLKVQTTTGVEGYTAAWLYTISDTIEQPVAVSAESAAIPPLDTSTADNGLLPSEGNAASSANEPGIDDTPADNSIDELDVVPTVEDNADTIIDPYGGSILALGIPEPAAPAGVSSGNNVSDADSLPGDDELSDNAADPDSPAGPLSVEPANNIVPITVDVIDNTEVATAELAINGRSMDVFTGEPYAFDLDTNLLSAGTYELSFTVTENDGYIRSDSVYFEVVLEPIPAPASLTADTTGDDAGAASDPDTPVEVADAGVTVNQSPDAAAQDIDILGASAPTAQTRRALLIDGEEQPFDLEFSSDDGLVLAAPSADAAPVQATADASLTDILGRPFSALVPTPIWNALSAPRPTLASIIILVMVISLLPQGFLTLYWMTYTWNKPHVADEYRSPKEFAEPQYSITALVPARREDGVIADTIRAVDRINYPEHLKEVLVLIRDEDDDDTINAARQAIAEIGKDNIRLVTFTDGPRNKPNGLNRGLRAATKDVVCIFDAEDEPHPDIYNVVNTVMIRDNADVVQSGVQLMNFRSTWFSALNVLEYFFWFKSGLHAFTREFKITPLGGNTVFFKRHWLERIDGWDEQCLTEDADVGFRLTQLGAKIQIVYDQEHATREETPDTVDSFIKQRTRWCQGFYQIFFKGDWNNLPTLKQKIFALYILLNSLLQAAMLFYVPVGLFVALTQRVPVVVALLSYIPIYILVIQLIIQLIGIREFTSAYNEKLPRFFTLRMIVFFYPYQLLLSIAALRAVYRMLTQQSAWEKTAHSNLHRQGQFSQVGS